MVGSWTNIIWYINSLTRTHTHTNTHTSWQAGWEGFHRNLLMALLQRECVGSNRQLLLLRGGSHTALKYKHTRQRGKKTTYTLWRKDNSKQSNLWVKSNFIPWKKLCTALCIEYWTLSVCVNVWQHREWKAESYRFTVKHYADHNARTSNTNLVFRDDEIK